MALWWRTPQVALRVEVSMLRTGQIDMGGEMEKSCPNCSASLVGHSCKLRCPRCNYFESCSDLEAFPTDFVGFTPIDPKAKREPGPS
jgi:ribosomal protein S27AE